MIETTFRPPWAVDSVHAGGHTHSRGYLVTEGKRVAFWQCSMANGGPCPVVVEPPPPAGAIRRPDEKPCSRNHPLERMIVTLWRGERRRRCADCNLDRYHARKA